MPQLGFELTSVELHRDPGPGTFWRTLYQLSYRPAAGIFLCFMAEEKTNGQTLLEPNSAWPVRFFFWPKIIFTKWFLASDFFSIKSIFCASEKDQNFAKGLIWKREGKKEFLMKRIIATRIKKKRIICSRLRWDAAAKLDGVVVEENSISPERHLQKSFFDLVQESFLPLLNSAVYSTLLYWNPACYTFDWKIFLGWDTVFQVTL